MHLVILRVLRIGADRLISLHDLGFHERVWRIVTQIPATSSLATWLLPLETSGFSLLTIGGSMDSTGGCSI